MVSLEVRVPSHMLCVAYYHKIGLAGFLYDSS
jgi:hypothetical protein